MGIWQIRPAGRCPRCLEPVGLVQLADGRRYRCSMPPRLLNAGVPGLEHAHERPAAHEPECPGVPRAEVAFAQMSARVAEALARLERRLASMSATRPAPVPAARPPAPERPRRGQGRGTPIVLEGGEETRAMGRRASHEFQRLYSFPPMWCPRCAAPAVRRYESARLPGGREGLLTAGCTACKWAIALTEDGVWQRCRVTSATTPATESEAYEWRLLEQR
jgi:hypothetical protein